MQHPTEMHGGGKYIYHSSIHPFSPQHPFFTNVNENQWLYFNVPIFFCSHKKWENHETHEYFLFFFFKTWRRENLSEDTSPLTSMCLWARLKGKMTLFWWSSCMLYRSILAVLSSRLLRHLEVPQVYGCQQLCNNKPWLCTQANYCWSQREPDYFLPESAWSAAESILRAEPFAWVLLFSILNAEIEAEQKLSDLPEAEQRGTDYRGKEVGLVTPKIYSSIGRLLCSTSMHCKEN